MVNGPQRGLPSLQESRGIRQRAIVQGRVRMRDAQPQFWLWTIVGFLAFGVIYWRYAENELATQKSEVMARQRAFAVTLGPLLNPLRDKAEGWTSELAGPWAGEELAADLSLKTLSESPGLYLRLQLDEAADVEKLRKAADRSLHDGFTSCLFVREARGPSPEGKQCVSSGDCPMGQICNEYDACAVPTQPYNLRLMYRALRILSSKWTDELHQATSDYQVRIFDRDLDKVAKTDVPIGVELTKSARYFTVLLDEMPEGGLPALPTAEGAEPIKEGPMEQLQAVPHKVRLGVWDLQTGRQLVRYRTTAGATFVPLGKAAGASLRNQRAQQRQVNNCSIAQALREKVAAREQAAP